MGCDALKSELKLRKNNRWLMRNSELAKELMDNSAYYYDLMKPCDIEIKDSINIGVDGSLMMEIKITNESKTLISIFEVSFSMLKYAPYDFEDLLLKHKNYIMHKEIIE
jgi:hypothetical protein